MNKKNKVKKRHKVTGKLSEAIAEEILSNNKLSLQIALEMDKTQIAVQNSARRRSDTLLNVRLMPLYESYGYFLEDIKNE
jgi:hypothetical protein|nr:MAG TPA: hypothetical protein [Caudoviricetes sp.]